MAAHFMRSYKIGIKDIDLRFHNFAWNTSKSRKIWYCIQMKYKVFCAQDKVFKPNKTCLCCEY